MFGIQLDDVIASCRNHEDGRHAGMDDVPWRSASVTCGLLLRGAAAKIEQDVTHVDQVGVGADIRKRAEDPRDFRRLSRR